MARRRGAVLGAVCILALAAAPALAHRMESTSTAGASTFSGDLEDELGEQHGGNVNLGADDEDTVDEADGSDESEVEDDQGENEDVDEAGDDQDEADEADEADDDADDADEADSADDESDSDEADDGGDGEHDGASDDGGESDD